MARITLRQLLDHAAEHGYGVPAFNINNMEQGLAIMEAAAAENAPVIIQASRGARQYANDIVGVLARAAAGLDDHRRVLGGGGLHDGQALLHVVDVEGGHAVAVLGGVVE